MLSRTVSGIKVARCGLWMVLFLVLCLDGSPALAAPPLFSLRERAGQGGDDPSVVSRQGVEIDEKLLSEVQAGSDLRFDLPDGPVVEGRVEEVHTTGRGARVYTGRIPGREGAHFVIVTRGAEIVGDISLPPLGLYALRRSAVGGRELLRKDPRRLQRCGADEPGLRAPGGGRLPQRQTAETATSTPLAAQADDAAQYDLMIVYTPAARAAAGGTGAIEALAELAVENANVVYANSNLSIRARLVHTEEIAYVESGSVHTDVNRLRSTNDGYMDGVHALRDQYRADLVSLWVKQASDYGGYGVFNEDQGANGVNTLLSAGGFTALVYSQASPILLAHEIGHNFGCAHDAANASGPVVYPYAYGWRFTGRDGKLYRTVMAYDPGNWIPYFSSPALFYQGVATGVADMADNARAMAESAFTVANFRNSQTGTPMDSVPFFQGSVAVGQGFYFLSFLGYFAPFQFPYLYHDELGYLYAIDAADDSSGIYLFDFQGLGFLYTSPALYPYLYSFDRSAFLYYFTGTTSPRVFVNLATGQFLYD